MELRLSKKQLDKIQYECDLLRLSPDRLYAIAPHLFIESITPTREVESKVEQVAAPDEDFSDSLRDSDDYSGYDYYNY